MKAISIRQPWAWLIINGGKNIENRSWPTRLRGRVLVHASRGMTVEEYINACHAAWRANPLVLIPNIDALEYGGIIGSVEITECVTSSDSPWFFGPNGFVLANPEPIPFRPLKGRLGFFTPTRVRKP